MENISSPPPAGEKLAGFLSLRGLSFKMIVSIYSAVLIISVIVLGYIYSVSEKTIKNNLTENSKLVTASVVNRIERFLVGVQAAPDYLAPAVLENLGSDKEIVKLFTETLKKNPDIFGMAIAFEPEQYRKGEHYSSIYVYRHNDSIKVTDLNGKDYDYFSQKWYTAPKEDNRSHWSEPYYDEGGGNILMSTYSAPLYKYADGKNRFIGIITADVPLSYLNNILSSLKIYETGYAYLISGEGRFISHPKDELIYKETILTIADKLKNEDLKMIGKSMMRGESSFAELTYKNYATGKMSWFSFAPVKLNNWSLGIIYPVDELTAELNGLFLKALLIGSSGGLMILLIIIFIARSITGPLRMLAATTTKFGEGNFDVELPRINTRDEIAGLNNSFVFMQGELKRTINELKNANAGLEKYSDELEAKVEERTLELKIKNTELDSALKNVTTLAEIGRKITSSLKLDYIVDTLNWWINSLVNTSFFNFLIFNEEENILEFKFASHCASLPAPIELNSDAVESFEAWCAKNQKPVFVSYAGLEYKQFLNSKPGRWQGKTIASVICVPMLIGQKLIGVISVYNETKNSFSRSRFEMLGAITNYASIAVENSFAYEAIDLANKNLKDAQAQLVQSEKMASLGQLTAGIAHEIKNPLNFITNFAEVSEELAQELVEDISVQAEKIEPKTLKNINALVGDISSNLKKINEHGKKADSIVKGMLLHSRGKSGEMQKTNINSMLEEYVSLAYHGFRARDASFNVKIETSYEASLKPINVVPQNISRVFLNILNNACYSTNEKKKEKGEKYSPVLFVSTKSENGKTFVTIRDNGKGIPKEALDKVFNPFFTTKPAGQGTGLGLSLSYDIVVQEHKGELRVNSEEGEYAEFIVTIPENL